MQRAETYQRILDALRDAFAPEELTLEDESHLHRGHVGAQSGKGHYKVSIVAAAFADKPPLARHRLIYQALGGLMDTDIHALSIDAKSPHELAR